MTSYTTPPTVAKSLGVNVCKILVWIRSGELRAIDVSLRRGVKPRWRIAQTDLDTFLAGRTASPPPKVTRRRRRADPQVIEFF